MQTLVKIHNKHAMYKKKLTMASVKFWTPTSEETEWIGRLLTNDDSKRWQKMAVQIATFKIDILSLRLRL